MGKKLNLSSWLWLVFTVLSWSGWAADPNAGLGLVDPAGLPPLATNASPQQLLENYELKAERGDYAAAVQLARWNIWGGFPGLPVLTTNGVYWLTFAARNNYVPAYSYLGWLYMDGTGVPRDYDLARLWFEKGAAEHDARCFVGLGLRELAIDPSHPDIEGARNWVGKGAESGLPDALYQMGRLYELRDIGHDPAVRPNYTVAADWYQRAAASNHVRAAERLVQLAVEGYVHKDVISILQRASDLNSANARLELARRYLAGDGKPRSTNDQPERLLETLFVQGNIAGTVALSDLYRTGRRVPKDPIRSIYLLHYASMSIRNDSGALERLEDLGDACRSNRKPSPENAGLEKEYPHYRQAYAEYNNAQIAAEIGRNYLNGKYPKDEVSACAWLELAGSRKDAGAAAERDALYSKLTAEQTNQVYRMVHVLGLSRWKGLP